MASIIKIKRSGNTASPVTLATGELAYSWYNDTNKLYLGTGTETNGAAANIDVIGGKFFTDMLDHTAGIVTANSAIIVDANKKINELFVDNISIDGNTITSTDTNGNINITPNGTGKVILTNIYTDTTTSLEEYIFDTVGGAITAGTGITVTNSDPGNTSTVSITATGVTAGTYGSTSAIPVFTVNAQGQITSASTSDIATTLDISGDTGTDSVNLLSDSLAFLGTDAIDTAVTNNTVTISIKDATTTTKGAASFSSDSFSVTSGQVTIKTGGVSNSQLANSSVTIGSSTVSLGSTITSLAGLTSADIDNINIDGNTISATNANGSINLVPLGTGTVDVNSARITNVAEPVNAADAVTKQYVDSVAAGLDPKASVRAATTANISLTGVQTIDGVSLSVGDRVLVKNQNTNTQNGIYVVSNTSWTRATDFDSPQEITAGAFFFVEEGSAYADSGWVVSSASVGTVGTDAIEFTQFSGAGQIVAGSGLEKTGNQIDVQVAAAGGIEISSNALQLKSSLAGTGLTYTNGVLNVEGTADRISVTNDAVDIANTYAGQSSITTLGTITTGTWQGTLLSPTYGGTGVNNGSNTITLSGNVTFSGAYTTTLTSTANTSITLPTTGTLATLAGTETLTNKTLSATTIGGHLIPDIDVTHDLGSSTKRFKDLYLSGNTIKLGDATISSSGTSVTINSINNTPIGDLTASTGAFTTLSATGQTTLTANIASSSYTTGTLVITGGLGVSGNINGGPSSSIDGFTLDGGTY